MKQIQNISQEIEIKFFVTFLCTLWENQIAKKQQKFRLRKKCWIINYLHDFDEESQSIIEAKNAHMKKRK